MNKKEKNPVLIVGAGPVGMVAALCLAESGADVKLIEEQWRSASRSYALALHPSSLRLLDELGLADVLIAQGNRVNRMNLYSEGGDLKGVVDFSKLSGKYPFVLVLSQQALEQALQERLSDLGVKVLWNHRMVGLEARESSVEVLVEKLSKESTGYSVSRTEWVVDKTIEAHASYLIGADGHRSETRRRMDLEWRELSPPSVFAVFEFVMEESAEPEDTMSLVVGDSGKVSVLWPMGGGRFRWSFELEDEALPTDARRKSRLFVELRNESFPHVSEEMMADLVVDRAPWFTVEVEEVLWSAAVRFENRLAEKFGQGRISLIGDSAHLALPVGIQSMNIGFLEAEEISACLALNLDAAEASSLLERCRENQLARWVELLNPSETKAVDAGWACEHSQRIPACVPASGDDLKQLLSQLGL